MTTRRILFTTFGSLGDLFPYLAIGLELSRRGHHVTIATSRAFRGTVESTGLHFHPVRPDIQFSDRGFLERAFERRRGTELIIRGVCGAVRESYQDTLPAAREADLIVTHALAYAGVAIAESTGLPWISTMLSPINFLSAYDPPVLAPAPWIYRLKPLGPQIFRFLYGVGRKVSWSWAKDVTALRKELGLSISAHPLFEGAMSPRLVLALFSEEFARKQQDWPAATVLTGFPFFEDKPTLPPVVEDFLASGPPPLVFTLGSAATGAAGDFYRASFQAVRALGSRALFLTGDYPQGLAAQLPPEMLAVPYAPHEMLFHRSAAVIHHGGVGTTAHAMRAGKPMLLVPFAHDQYDNAERIRRLGAGAVLPRDRYRADLAESALRELLDGDAARVASAIGARVSREHGAQAAADAIESSL